MTTNTPVEGSEIRRGDRFIVLPRARYSDGSVADTFPAGTEVEAVWDGVDVDRDAKVKKIGETNREYIRPEFLVRKDQYVNPNLVVVEGLKVGDRVEVYKNPDVDKYVPRDYIGTTVVIKAFTSSGEIADVTMDDGGETSHWIENLRKLSGPTPASVEDAFKVGNTIRFTASAIVANGRITVGCKEPRLTEVMDKMVSMVKNGSRWDVTFETEVTSDFGQPVISHAGVNISASEADGYFKDVVIVSTKQREKKTLELEPEVADALMTILGKFQTGSVLSPLYRELSNMDDVVSSRHTLVYAGGSFMVRNPR